jgi:periplasmic protein CpxP/Spy
MKTIILALGLMLAMALPKFAMAQDSAGSTDTAAAPAAGASNEGPVEKRVQELHTKLKITKSQETLWAAVAKEMHDTANTFTDAIGEREKSAQTMTAIDDLKSYAAIAEMHAKSMNKFIDAFSPLYDAMTPAQKKNADTVFREHKNGKKRSGGQQ